MEDLTQCRELTVKKYEDRGVTIIRRTQADFDLWLAGEGRSYEKAELDFQRIAFAYYNKVDAIGGVSWLDSKKSSRADNPVDSKPIYFGWCINLRACEFEPGLISSEQTEIGPRILPTGVDALNRPLKWAQWTIPNSIVSRKPNRWPELLRVRTKYEAYIGIESEPTTGRVKWLDPEAPAIEHDIRIGDRIISIDDKAVSEPCEFKRALSSIGQPREVLIKVERDGKIYSKNIVPANRMEFEARRLANLEDHPVPDFEATTLNGEEFRLRDLKGKIIILSLWPEKMPVFEMMAREMARDGVIWVNVTVGEDDKRWHEYVANNRLSGIQIRSPDWAERVAVLGYPTAIIDRKGTLRLIIHGSDPAGYAKWLVDEAAAVEEKD